MKVISFTHAIVIPKYIDNPNKRIILGKVFIGANIVHNVIRWFEISTSVYYFLYQSALRDYLDKNDIPITFFYNENYFADYILLNSIFLIYQLGKTPKMKKIRILMLLLSSNLLLIIMSKSRSVLLLRTMAIIILFFSKFGRKIHIQAL